MLDAGVEVKPTWYFGKLGKRVCISSVSFHRYILLIIFYGIWFSSWIIWDEIQQFRGELFCFIWRWVWTSHGMLVYKIEKFVLRLCNRYDFFLLFSCWTIKSPCVLLFRVLLTKGLFTARVQAQLRGEDPRNRAWPGAEMMVVQVAEEWKWLLRCFSQDCPGSTRSIYACMPHK